STSTGTATTAGTRVTSASGSSIDSSPTRGRPRGQRSTRSLSGRVNERTGLPNVGGRARTDVRTEGRRVTSTAASDDDAMLLGSRQRDLRRTGDLMAVAPGPHRDVPTVSAHLAFTLLAP